MAGPSSQHDQAGIRRVQPDGALLFCGTNLRVRVTSLKPGFVLASAHGAATDAEDASAEVALLAEFDRELKRAGTLTLFADLRESPRMPAASREKITQWARLHQPQLLPSHVLVRSNLLEMAMSIIAMLLGGGLIKVHSSRRPSWLCSSRRRQSSPSYPRFRRASRRRVASRPAISLPAQSCAGRTHGRPPWS